MRPVAHIPDVIEKPYPIEFNSYVIAGYGRGSAELGIPTANIPVNSAINSLETGIYFGTCRLSPSMNTAQQKESSSNRENVQFNNGQFLKGNETKTQPMVMSIGWNPFYNNTEKAAEVHIIHKFGENFYGASIKVTILGYIRHELNYTTKGMLLL